MCLFFLLSKVMFGLYEVFILILSFLKIFLFLHSTPLFLIQFFSKFWSVLNNKIKVLALQNLMVHLLVFLLVSLEEGNDCFLWLR